MEKLKAQDIIKVLRTCANMRGCDGCPARGENFEPCNTMMRQAANRLEMLNCRAAPENKPLTKTPKEENA
jgi:hypothetical protein